MMKLIGVIVFNICFTFALGNPVLVVENAPPQGHGYKLGHDYRLHCSGTPASGCRVVWHKDDRPLTGSTSRILVVVQPGSVVYRCSFSCSNGDDPSNDVTLIGQNLIRAEILNSGVSGVEWTPLVNSVLDLSCDYELLSSQFTKSIEQRSNPTFEWMENGAAIGTSQNLMIDALEGINRTLTCRVTLGDDSLESDAVHIMSTDEIDEPEVVFKHYGSNNDVINFQKGSDYVAYCRSKSHCVDAKYLWTRDYFTIADVDVTRNYHLKSADELTHDGAYRCRMTLESREQCSTNSVMIEVLQAGRVCQSDSQCDGKEYSRSCKSSRCECAEGYEPNGDVCAGVSRLLASGLILILAFILSRVF